LADRQLDAVTVALPSYRELARDTVEFTNARPVSVTAVIGTYPSPRASEALTWE
jgi:hypothetical protein